MSVTVTAVYVLSYPCMCVMICVFLSFLPGITQFFIVNTLLAEYSPVGKQGYKGLRLLSDDVFLLFV